MPSSEHEQVLASVPILSRLSGRQRARLVDASRVIEHPAGREVAAEGEGALALHVILAGTALVSVNGVEKRTLHEGEYFGEISLIDGRPRSATVTALEPLTCLAVPHLTFKKLIDDDPACARDMLVLLCERLREAESIR